jgi:hypothetical protein
MKNDFYSIMEQERVNFISEKEKLLEQIFNKTKRLYYHISDKPFSQFNLSYYYGGCNQKYGAIFLSPKVEFTVKFFKHVFPVPMGLRVFLYTCKLTRSLNLFNPSSEKDFLLIEKTFSNDKVDKIIELMMEKNPRDEYIIESPDIISLAGDNGYDGVNTYGYGREGFTSVENIAVFHTEDVNILKRDEIML